MPLHSTWAACATSIARCLTATTPALADWMFSAAREAGALGDSAWFRLPPGLAAGFAWLGPQAADHRYRAAPPTGVDPTALEEAPVIAHGRLRVEADAFLRDARALAAGQEIRINGGRIPIEPTAEAVAAASSVETTLGAALGVSDPVESAALLREVALGFLRRSGEGQAALDAATEAVGVLRARLGANAPIWALAQVRAEIGPRLLAGTGPAPVLFKLFDPFGPGAEPEAAVRRAVADLREAGEADALEAAAITLLARAEVARERALESRGVVAHGVALYEAAGDAWAAAALAWPPSPTATAAADLSLRTTHALVVDTLNLGSGTVLLRHQAQIAAEGAARADELIESAGFYPRALRALLMAPAAG